MPSMPSMQKRETVFDNILGTVNHTYAMDVVWRAHLEGKSHECASVNPQIQLSLSELHEVQAQIDSWYIRYVDNLDLVQSEEIVNFAFIGGHAASMSRGEILLHVVNHGTYHRAHIDVLHPISVAPPVTDLPVYLCNQS